MLPQIVVFTFPFYIGFNTICITSMYIAVCVFIFDVLVSKKPFTHTGVLDCSSHSLNRLSCMKAARRIKFIIKIIESKMRKTVLTTDLDAAHHHEVDFISVTLV